MSQGVICLFNTYHWLRKQAHFKESGFLHLLDTFFIIFLCCKAICPIDKVFHGSLIDGLLELLKLVQRIA